MITVMTEHLFPHDPRRAVRDLVHAAILHHLLARHPQGVAVDDLASSVMGRPAPPAARRAVRSALASLAAHGLVEHTGARVAPTRAALRFDRLMTGGAGGPPSGGPAPEGV